MDIVKGMANAFFLTAILAVGVVFTGCDEKRTVLDVDTPNGNVSVERNVTDGGVEVDIEKDK